MISLPWRDLGFGTGPMISTSLAQVETGRLQELAAGRDVLEVGSAYGYSTVAMGMVAKGVTTIDPHETHRSLGILRGNLEAYSLTGKVDVRVGYSSEVLPEIEADQAYAGHGRLFDLAFLDGDHTAPGLTLDVGWALRLVKPGGFIACHDYDEATCPGVRAALDALFPAGPHELVNTLFIIEVTL